MRRPWLQTLFRLALVAALGFAVWTYIPTWRAGGMGMTEQPCTADGKSITGRPRDDWAGLCVYREANARLIAGGKHPRAVLIGDSLTQDWGGFEPGLFGSELVNRGVGGHTSAQVLLRFQQDVVALRPRIVHILVGTNDIAGNTGPESPESYLANVRAMVDMAEANRIAVVIGTIPPARDFFWRPRVSPGNWASRLNKGLTQLAQERGLVLAHYQGVLAADGGSGVDPVLYRDGSHPGAKGYAAMRPVLLAALDAAEGDAAEEKALTRP